MLVQDAPHGLPIASSLSKTALGIVLCTVRKIFPKRFTLVDILPEVATCNLPYISHCLPLHTDVKYMILIRPTHGITDVRAALGVTLAIIPIP